MNNGAMIGRWGAVAIALMGCLSRVAGAQRTDIILGRVTDDGGRVVAGADVVLTRAYDLMVFNATTGAAGDYRVVIPNGRQDYLLFVSTPGFKPFQKRVRLAPGDSVIHGDAMLAPAPPQKLNVVRSQAAPNRPPRRDYSMNGGPGGDEMNKGGVTAGLTPDQMGDLNAIAQLMPGMAGGTMFGLPADGNGMLLDGLSFQGGTLPRDASVRSSNCKSRPARATSSTSRSCEPTSGCSPAKSTWRMPRRTPRRRPSTTSWRRRHRQVRPGCVRRW